MRRLSWTVPLAMMVIGSTGKAAPVCLDLTRRQAEKAVTVAKISLHKGSALIFRTRKESGLVKPLGVWVAKSPKKRSRYRVLVDGRPLDISLVYVARSAQDNKAFNLGWLAGCRPAAHNPLTIRNW